MINTLFIVVSLPLNPVIDIRKDYALIEAEENTEVDISICFTLDSS